MATPGKWVKPKIRSPIQQIGTVYVKSRHHVLDIDYKNQELNKDELRRKRFLLRRILDGETSTSTIVEIVESMNGHCPHCGLKLPNSLTCECGYKGKEINPVRDCEPKAAAVKVVDAKCIKTICKGDYTLYIEE